MNTWFKEQRTISAPLIILGHAALALSTRTIVQDWLGLSLVLATAVGALGTAALVEGIQHLSEGTASTAKLRDRLADAWDYQLVWLFPLGALSSGGLMVGAGVWLAVRVVAEWWRVSAN